LTVDLPQVALGIAGSQSTTDLYSVTLGNITGQGSSAVRARSIEGRRDRSSRRPIPRQTGSYGGRRGRFTEAGLGPSSLCRNSAGAARSRAVKMPYGLRFLRRIDWLVACLSWYAKRGRRGLRPLGELKQEIDARGIQGGQISAHSICPGCRRKLSRRNCGKFLLQRLDLAIELVRRFTADASHQMRRAGDIATHLISCGAWVRKRPGGPICA